MRMAAGSLARVSPRLRGIALVSQGTASDADLLERFVSYCDEIAFELLVRRHGPMVFAVCRRVLRHTQDAEDAFQATFLVLAHKAASVSPRNKLAGFLYGVAYKTALKARQRASRRLEVEKHAPARNPEEMNPDTNWNEVEPLLDQELSGLPEHYRLPIVLCDLEGRPRLEVAGTLGCSEGTLSSRLTRGRRMLAARLKRRGVHLSATALAVLLAERSAVLAEPLIFATVPVALSAVAASTTRGAAECAVSPSVASLATGVMKSMFLKKLKIVALVAFAAIALTGLVAYRSSAAPVPQPTPGADDKAVIDSLSDVEGKLLMNRKVIKDMKCDINQLDQIMDLLEEAEKKAGQKTTEAMGQIKFNVGGAPPNPEAIQKMIKDAQEAGEKEFQKAVGSVVKDILTPAQRKRLREIDLQVRGHEAFTSPSVAKTLEITAKQKEQFEANAKHVEDDIVAAFQKPLNVPVPLPAPAPAPVPGGGAGGGVVFGGFTPIDYEKVVRDARAEGLKRALAILTDDQKSTWKKLTGEPFTHPISNPKWMRIGFGGGRVGIGIGGVGGVGGVKVAPPIPALPVNPPPGVLPVKIGPGGAQVLPAPVNPPPVVPPAPPKN
jgi:RNA polymerase sigma factor (sigma-70 family)